VLSAAVSANSKDGQEEEEVEEKEEEEEVAGSPVNEMADGNDAESSDSMSS